MDRITLPPEPIRRRIEADCGLAPGVARWTPASGGLSDASVWRLEEGGQPLAVRYWGESIEPPRVQRIAQLLQNSHQAGLSFVAAPIGEPIRDDSDGLWEIAPWKPGTPLAETGVGLEAAVAGLAQWHAVASDLSEAFMPSMAMRDRLDRLVAIAASSPTRLDRRVATQWPELEAISPRLQRAAEHAAVSLRSIDWSQTTNQIIHGDARPEHFLLENGELTGLIDFGAMRRDTPWADLARLAGELGPGRIDEVATLYEVASGQPVDRAAITALDLAGAVLSLANWTRWLSDPSRRWPDPESVRQRLRSVSARLAAAGFGPA